MLTLIIGDSPATDDGPAMAQCIIYADPMVPGGALLPDPIYDLSHWIGMFPFPQLTTDAYDAYLFTVEDDGSLKSLADRSELVAMQAYLNGRAHVIVAGMDGQQSAQLAYTVPRSR